MNAAPVWRERMLALLRWLLGMRFIKFGTVGASGLVVNLTVAHFSHEYLFQSLEGPQGTRFASVALAIMVSTVNNFTWNRLWTWADRIMQTSDDEGIEALPTASLLAQFAKYALASWFGSALQYGLTLWFSQTMHSMLASVIAIAIASVSNFLAYDRWTFRKR